MAAKLGAFALAASFAVIAGCNAPTASTTSGDATVEQSMIGRLAAEIAALDITTNQTAAGDINDAWSGRISALSGPLALLAYVFGVRPLRKRWWAPKCDRCGLRLSGPPMCGGCRMAGK